MLTLTLTLCSLACATTPPTGFDTPGAPEGVIEAAHADQYQQHLDVAPKQRAELVPPTLQPLEETLGPTREVLGYLPYWELDYTDFNWDKMTTLAFFCASMDSMGDLTNLHGWTGATSEALRDEAHAHNVRYVLTIVNFDSASIKALVNDPARRSHAIDVMLDSVISMGADGVNIDFEGVPKAAKAGLTAFMQETTAAFHEAIPGSHVTMATPAVDWSGAFDYDALAEGSDGLMIMAYGYHWNKGNPGPLSPPVSGDVWGPKNLTWTIQDYMKWGKEENRHKFILGLPFYGYDWLATGPEIPGKAAAKAKYVPYWKCEERAEAAGGFMWDEASQSTYFLEEKADGWHQIWCDDGPSWLAKLSLVTEYDLGGVGIWALGYDRGTTALWDAIAAELVPSVGVEPSEPEPEPEPDVEPEPEPEPDVEPEPEIDPDSANPDSPPRAPQSDPAPLTPDPGAAAVVMSLNGGESVQDSGRYPGRRRRFHVDPTGLHRY